MLKETLSSEERNKRERRWFSDDYFDLIVWINDQKAITGFQLCYDKFKKERALTWTARNGFKHERVDDGEENPAKNLAPILVPDGFCPIKQIFELFTARAQNLDPDVKSFVTAKLHEYPDKAGVPE